MTTEQAIEELKSDRELYEGDIVYVGDGTPDGDLMLALDMGIAALKKQIPKKPHKIYEKLNVKWCECGCYLGGLKDEQNYCRRCGQAIDWSGDCE